MSAWSCSFTKHELHLRVTAKCCKSFFLALKTRFTPLQSFSCACKFYLRLQSYVHFHKSYHTHANLYDVKLPSYVTVCFFTHTDWFYAVNPFCSSLNCCFRLQITVHRLAVLLTVFWRKKRAKSVSAEKWKSYECRSYLFSVSMKLQFHKTWITLTSNSKMLQIFFSYA